MDQWKTSEGFFHGGVPAEFSAYHRENDHCPLPNRLQGSCLESSQRVEHEASNPVAVRKVQKADREKLRRDRLNEQFTELGNALDPDRPKNDKATILADTIQMLKDLTAQVDRLKAEYTSLSEESSELTQEKNELREEKAAIKSDIDNLNAQYQQRLRCMYPWTAVDPSVIMGPPPPYPFPLPVPIPSGPIPIPSLHPYPFFQNPAPGAIPAACPSYVPYAAPCLPQVEQPPSQRVPPHPHPSSSRSNTASRQDSRSKSSDHQQRGGAERSDDFSDVVTELELKTPGSTVAKVTQDQASSSIGRKEKQWTSQRKGNANADGSSLSRCSSSPGLPDSSSNSAGDGSVANN